MAKKIGQANVVKKNNKKVLVKKKLEENLGWEKIESKKLLVKGNFGVKILKKKNNLVKKKNLEKTIGKENLVKKSFSK